MQKTQKILITLIQLALLTISTLLLIRLLTDPTYTKYPGVITSFILTLAPTLLTKIFHLKLSFTAQLTYLAFLFISLYLGINLDLYKTLPGFDKFTHLLSGALSAILGYYLLIAYSLTKTPKSFQVITIICVCITIGVLWEYFEFGCDQLLGQNMQQLITPGVEDTMYDLLSATIGAIIAAPILVLHPTLTQNLIMRTNKK